jgi:hypothetical protein
LSALKQEIFRMRLMVPLSLAWKPRKISFRKAFPRILRSFFSELESILWNCLGPNLQNYDKFKFPTAFHIKKPHNLVQNYQKQICFPFLDENLHKIQQQIFVQKVCSQNGVSENW